MPMDFEALVCELEARGERFEELERDSAALSRKYREALKALDPSTPEDTRGLDEWCGARVAEAGPLVRPVQFTDRSRFINKHLIGNRVAAVDGSQVAPDRSFDIPLAIANTATVLNDYETSGQEVRTQLKVVPPLDRESEAERGDPYSDRAVKTERDLLEIAAAEEAMESDADLVLFDNSLVPAFVNYREEDTRVRYVKKIVSLLETSCRTQTPLIGYLDRSMSTETLTMLRHILGEDEDNDGMYAPFLTNAKLFDPLLPEGGRTKAFEMERWDVGKASKRQPLLAEYAEHGYDGGIGFVYLDLGGNLPKRVEFPLWMLGDGELDMVIDIIRAEAMRGEKYPHILLEAHDSAVVRRNEAKHAYRLFEQYVDRRDIEKDRNKERS